MKIKTSELQGAALDWAVGKCEKKKIVISKERKQIFLKSKSSFLGYLLADYSPSTDWAQSGPIIEREKLRLVVVLDGYVSHYGTNRWNITEKKGPTPLIAAMRCYVASKLGNDVDIPKELVK